MTRALTIAVRLHDGRYHGMGDWPPSPARLFQALVAGAASGGRLSPEARKALTWLEGLPPPVVAAPRRRDGQAHVAYVPNNDLDSVGGDPALLPKLRVGKTVRPRFVAADTPFIYVWQYGDGSETEAALVCNLAGGLYQLGRGVDAAWATGTTADADEAAMSLERFSGTVHRPTPGSSDPALPCPRSGTLVSLENRYAANRRKLSFHVLGGRRQELFAQPPRALFAHIGYDCPPQRLLYEIRRSDGAAGFASVPQGSVSGLAVCLRDIAVARLAGAESDRRSLIEAVLVGREAREADKASRVRIVPLPSIGHTETSRSIRRVLVEVPPDCPVDVADIDWAFSGLELPTDFETGEVEKPGTRVLMRAAGDSMLRHFGIGPGMARRRWQTVTPVALPVARPPGRVGGEGRLRGTRDAAAAMHAALRHAGISAPVESIVLQREPFARRGRRAEEFAASSRFDPANLWHAELSFAEGVRGPLLIGDGRYLGLGLLAPVSESPRDIVSMQIQPGHRPPVAERDLVVRAVRRAIMSLAADENRKMPPLFSGHEADRKPAASGEHRHIFLLADDIDGDGLLDRIAVIAPWRADRTSVPGGTDRQDFQRVIGSLSIVRAGRAGVIALSRHAAPSTADPAFSTSVNWQSATDYQPTRHPKPKADHSAAVIEDIRRECARRGLPRPDVEITRVAVGPRGGLRARARLTFAVAVEGPILLGRDAHYGGGLFVASNE